MFVDDVAEADDISSEEEDDDASLDGGLSGFVVSTQMMMAEEMSPATDKTGCVEMFSFQN